MMFLQINTPWSVPKQGLMNVIGHEFEEYLDNDLSDDQDDIDEQENRKLWYFFNVPPHLTDIIPLKLAFHSDFTFKIKRMIT